MLQRDVGLEAEGGELRCVCVKSSVQLAMADAGAANFHGACRTYFPSD